MELGMSASEKKFLSLLFEEGLVLENLKFFPGDKCSSPDQLFEAGFDMISRALSGEGAEVIPVSNVESRAIGDLAPVN
jgi:hypothetical protein